MYDGLYDGFIVGYIVGYKEGCINIVALNDGLDVGYKEGFIVGTIDGTIVGQLKSTLILCLISLQINPFEFGTIRVQGRENTYCQPVTFPLSTFVGVSVYICIGIGSSYILVKQVYF